jgi:hypothetical protein
MGVKLGFCEEGAEENSSTEEEGSDRRMEKIAYY